MADLPQTKFNSPWTVANIEAELNGVKTARGNSTMTEVLAQKQDVLTFDDVPTDSSTNPVKSGGIYTELTKREPLTVGTGLVTTQTWDLHTLPIGKYFRQSNVSQVGHIPSDLSVAFYCIVENTIADNRRRILLYPAAKELAGVFYCCVETSSGYGSWYKFTGTVVPDPQS